MERAKFKPIIMALICMAVHDTVENKRSAFTKKTILCLIEQAELRDLIHRLVVIDNGSCEETQIFLSEQLTDSMAKYSPFKMSVIRLPENQGTAAAINEGLKLREPGEYVIKMDNDVIVHKRCWVDEMEEVINRMPQIGVLGLKRVDLGESPHSVNTDLRSRLLEVPHEHGQRWRVVEECKHVMGTCTMLNPALLDRIGYFYQMDGLYGFDDSLLCVRSHVAGFINCFLHGIDIDHIDPGGTEYAQWKQQYAGAMMQRYNETAQAFKTGLKNIYYNPYA